MALGPHPQRELTPMLALGFHTLGSASPKALSTGAGVPPSIGSEFRCIFGGRPRAIVSDRVRPAQALLSILAEVD